MKLRNMSFLKIKLNLWHCTELSYIRHRHLQGSLIQMQADPKPHFTECSYPNMHKCLPEYLPTAPMFLAPSSANSYIVY